MGSYCTCGALIDEDDSRLCPHCAGRARAEDPCLDAETCFKCFGDGGWHDCGEDCCVCANPDDVDWVECDECHGEGRIFSPRKENDDV